jgi:hypothetical protein
MPCSNDGHHDKHGFFDDDRCCSGGQHGKELDFGRMRIFLDHGLFHDFCCRPGHGFGDKGHVHCGPPGHFRGFGFFFGGRLAASVVPTSSGAPGVFALSSLIAAAVGIRRGRRRSSRR